jgi:hypothetical protein
VAKAEANPSILFHPVAALFDCGVAELINCGLFETSSVSFKFDQSSNPYFISKHCPEVGKQQDEKPSSPLAPPETE